MAKITMDNLSNNLKEYLANLGLTEEQVINIINQNLPDSIDEARVLELLNNFEDEKMGELNNLNTNAKDIVGAINELFQDVDSGKQIIADAIDDKNVDKNSTFAEMGTAIEDIHEAREADKQKLIDKLIDSGYELTGNESIDTLLELLNVSNISLSEVEKLVCGQKHVFILKSDDTVWACGDNQYGQLGLNDTTDRLAFTQVTINTDNVKDIKCGGEFTYIHKIDDTIWSCGYNYYGQLGYSTGSNNYQTTFTQVTTNATNVKEVVCGGYNTFIIKNDATIWACGDNDDGQLGLGSNSSKDVFTKVTTNVNNVKTIIPGNFNTFIIKYDDTVWACGENGFGELGLGNTTSKTTFTQVTTNVNNVKKIESGPNYSFMLKHDGTVWSCGHNGYGQLGLGNNTNKTTFTQVTTNVSDVKDILALGNKTLMVKNDNSLWLTGLPIDNTMNNSTTFKLLIDPGVDDVKEFKWGLTFIYMLKNDNSVWSYGQNSNGELGLGHTNAASIFTEVNLQNENLYKAQLDSLNAANIANKGNLSDILEDEGVEVTEDDTIASLITKVDEEFDRKNSEMIKFISGAISNTFFNHTHNVQSDANGGTTAGTIASLQANIGIDCSYYSIIYDILAQSNSKYYRIKEIHTYDGSKTTDFATVTYIYTETNASGTTNGTVYGGGQNYRPVIQENIAIIPMFTIQTLNLPNVTTVYNNYYWTACKDHVDTPYIEPEAPPIADLYILNNGYGSDVRFDTYWGPTYSHVSTDGWGCGEGSHVCTTTKINFSDYSKVVIKGKSMYAGGVYIDVAACSTNIRSNSGDIPTGSGVTICNGYKYVQANVEFELTIDISNLTGSQYLAIGADFPTGANMASASGTISVFKLTN